MHEDRRVDDPIEQLVRDNIRCIPDFPKPGILFRDITTVLEQPEAFQAALGFFAEAAEKHGATKIAGIESRGFVFAAPVAADLGLPLVLFRKPGKLPFKTRSVKYTLEYGTDTIEVHENSIQPGDRVMIIDDLLATGGTMSAAVRLVREMGAEVAVAAFMVELPSELNGRARLADVEIECMTAF
ncbi:MAG TPA: adenine phosphoribosyltransferase [Myxococcota bacterium]|nr:adenine phosphoribosyltransferase [Myxococcota bacterium]HOA13489.1 adenine phosphoribosyltransferase [Myxococcota bacterium]HOC99013.1 adenine phosphoribosyltransferase [Myxococcota bacterium]HOH76838.1 adenine phosphoribosyltransferase [Myxococcota bacterium]HPV04237.1 adenine phosphoribosyltransferase [Myxococcota bacterium]